jgi:hypothetical protein
MAAPGLAGERQERVEMTGLIRLSSAAALTLWPVFAPNGPATSAESLLNLPPLPEANVHRYMDFARDYLIDRRRRHPEKPEAQLQPSSEQPLTVGQAIPVIRMAFYSAIAELCGWDPIPSYSKPYLEQRRREWSLSPGDNQYLRSLFANAMASYMKAIKDDGSLACTDAVKSDVPEGLKSIHPAAPSEKPTQPCVDPVECIMEAPVSMRQDDRGFEPIYAAVPGSAGGQWSSAKPICTATRDIGGRKSRV